MTHPLEHAAQRRMIGVHDFSLVMLEAQRLERPLGLVRFAAARPDLLDAKLSRPDRWEDGIATRFAFPVFPCRGQSTHGSPLQPRARRRFPGARDSESPRARRRARARRAVPS